MAKRPNHLRFLLSLGNTKMIVLNNEQEFHIYSKKSPSSASNITAEHVTEALVTK